MARPGGLTIAHMTVDNRQRPVADGRDRSDVRLRLLVLALLALSLVVWMTGVPPSAAPTEEHLIVAALLAAAFVVAETAQLHLELRRQTFSLSLSELPLVVGLFLLPPWLLLGARLLAYAGVAVVRRMNPDKAAFNAALFTAEVSVALAVFHRLAEGEPADPSAWGAAYAATLAALLLSALAFFAAVRILQPPFRLRQMFVLALPGLVTGVFSTTVGLMIVMLEATSRWTMIGLLVVAAVLVWTYRTFGRLMSEHKNLNDLYELTREVSTSLSGRGLDERVLDRVRILMRAEVAQLWLAEDEELVGKPADRPSVHQPSPADDVRRRVLAGESVLAGPRTRDAPLRSALARRDVRELVAVPLRVGDAVVGSLEVVDRQGERSRFVAADRTLLETLAVHTSVALENAQLVDRLRHEAEHDPLTGLPNRKAFVHRLQAALDDVPAGRVLAVLVLDLQSFKDVNDTLGRAAGDMLLTEVASRLQNAAAEPRSVARLSSDEIGVFTPVADLAEARSAAVALQALLETPVMLGGVEIEVGAVVGIAVHPEHGDDAITLVQRADVAMYAAKRTSRGVLAYSATMDAPSVRRLGLVTELRRALDNRDLRVWYQPQVRLDRSELVGLEALVRWPHPEQGIIPPDEFIPVAEHTGLIGSLTTYVLTQALTDLREWRAGGHEFGVSVNISVRSLLDPGFTEEVRAALSGARIPPHLLTLEITESSVMSDPDRAVPVLVHLRDMGVRLSVDDFGTGQSSLTYLRLLPITEVKVDRSFVASMVHNSGDAAIVRAVIDISAPLGLTVVAEGVESDETRRELARLGCGVIQGYLLSRPLPREEMDRWLTRSTVAVPVEPGAAPSGAPRTGSSGRATQDATGAASPRWLRVVSG